MQAESLEVLEKASVAPAQARAIVRAIEIELVRVAETSATRNDLAVLGVDLRGEMAVLRAEIAKQGGELRDQMGGVPCIRGLRIPVASVVESLADGMSEAEILEAFPDLTADDIRDALRFAAEAVRERTLPLTSSCGSSSTLLSNS